MHSPPVAFLDRDGTVIEERHYLRDPDEVVLLPGVAAAMARLRAAGFLLVMVSNQSGVARGRMSLDDVARVNARMQELLAPDGATFDALLFCPHGPDDGCACRKPGTGMIDDFRARHSFDLAGSILVGDKDIDMDCARSAGLRGFLVTTGYGAAHAAQAETTGFSVCNGLGAVADLVLDTPAA